MTNSTTAMTQTTGMRENGPGRRRLPIMDAP
jgi:hypothetical protein